MIKADKGSGRLSHLSLKIGKEKEGGRWEVGGGFWWGLGEGDRRRWKRGVKGSEGAGAVGRDGEIFEIVC